MLLRVIEETTFLPLGSDAEDSSDFQLICGTNKDLKAKVVKGEFREDLLSRINLWTFEMPGLKSRPEDIAPNIDYELLRYAESSGRKISFNKEARDKFLLFATSKKALWDSNFRDLNGAIRRMTTLASGGRITEKIVDEEIKRLKKLWKPEESNGSLLLLSLLLESEIQKLDLFDQISLEAVLKLCKMHSSLSEAGRALYNVSRHKKQNQNDADRLSKYLKKFQIQLVRYTEKIIIVLHVNFTNGPFFFK